MTRLDSITEILGGEKGIGRKVTRDVDMMEAIHNGLRFKAFNLLGKQLHISEDQLREVVVITPRTLARRKQSAWLNPEESDRLFRVARIMAHARETFGDIDKASRWLRRANRQLSGKSPLEVLVTDWGAEQVDAILGRLEHGVFA
ncbi:MAG: DUF2384 domain-containing protein [Nitrospirota bacterium]|nr:DUF2384 domain-containing protein [Nitrospirota bacterium]